MLEWSKSSTASSFSSAAVDGGDDGDVLQLNLAHVDLFACARCNDGDLVAFEAIALKKSKASHLPRANGMQHRQTN